MPGSRPSVEAAMKAPKDSLLAPAMYVSASFGMPGMTNNRKKPEAAFPPPVAASTRRARSAPNTASTKGRPRILPMLKLINDPARMPVTDHNVPAHNPKAKPPAICTTSPGITKTMTWTIWRPMKASGASTPRAATQARTDSDDLKSSYKSLRKKKADTSTANIIAGNPARAASRRYRSGRRIS